MPRKAEDACLASLASNAFGPKLEVLDVPTLANV
jgi:hypothetical protein